MPKSTLAIFRTWLRPGQLIPLFLFAIGGCASAVQETRIDYAGIEQKEVPPLACRTPGGKAPQVTKLGPYSQYGESNLSQSEACRIAEEKATSLADLYSSEYESADWTCKKTIERASYERYVTIFQCLYNVEIVCEHAPPVCSLSPPIPAQRKGLESDDRPVLG